MVKRIPAVDILNRVRVLLVLKKDIIEVKTVKGLRAKYDYTIDPYKLTYSAYRSHCERKDFAIIRNNPYPWILRITNGDMAMFRIDSEKDIEVFKNYIRELRTVS